MQVSIWLVRAIISAVERAGASRTEFLALAGIEPELLERADARLRVEDYARALEAALELTQEPALGLRLGEHASAAMYHVVAHLVEHADTLGEAIATMCRYSGLLAPGFEPCLCEHVDLVSLRLPYLCGDSGAVRLTAEFAMVGFVRLLRLYAGGGAWPQRACFAYPAPPHAAQYRRAFGGAVRFDERFTELYFPRAWLEHAHLYGDPSLYAALQAHAERELARMSQASTVAERVERVLAMRQPHELPTMQEVARELAISARTLARRLQVEGVAYAQLLERRRSSAAKHLLDRRHLTIQEVASALGFADAPAFHKAFRRWTGLTPRQYVTLAGR